VANVTQKLLAYGCYEVSLGDTIGAGNPRSTAALLDRLRDQGVPMDK
jgi:hydroxymethylglutaryl-CoA lyase